MRVVVDGGLDPASLDPRCTVMAGRARRIRNVVARPATIAGRRVTNRPKRATAERSRAASDSSRRRMKGSRPRSIR